MSKIRNPEKDFNVLEKHVSCKEKHNMVLEQCTWRAFSQ